MNETESASMTSEAQRGVHLRPRPPSTHLNSLAFLVETTRIACISFASSCQLIFLLNFTSCRFPGDNELLCAVLTNSPKCVLVDK
jgi:hypothetical protein